LRDQLHWQLREWLRTDPTAMIPPDDLLEEELIKIKYVVDGNKIIVTPKKILKELLRGRSPDRMDALCLTFYNEESQAGTIQVANYRQGKPTYRKRPMKMRSIRG
jgi:hypothetical protein